MNSTRRGFLGALLAAPALAVLPKEAATVTPVNFVASEQQEWVADVVASPQNVGFPALGGDFALPIQRVQTIQRRRK